jgi:UDPglucose 6-dehydrogenase
MRVIWGIPGDSLKISIIGTGYVGLVSGVGFAAKGHSAIGVDAREEIVKRISRGESPIHEKGLAELLGKVLGNGSFAVTTNLEEAIKGTDITFICVGAPPQEDGSIDLGAIRKCARQIGEVLRKKEGFHTVVVKSTVLPGTNVGVVGEEISRASGKRANEGFGLAMNPEFLREGNAMADFLMPDRIVIGANDEKSFKVVEEVYSGRFGAPIVRANIPTAEMIKYANNAFLALCISFSNEIAQICERERGMDAVEVLRALAQDGRITTKTTGGDRIVPGIAGYLFPGCGFGGSCFPKDVSALRNFARSEGMRANLVEGILEVNEERIRETAKRAEGILEGVRGKKITVLGTAFKEDTDDVRESPSIKIIGLLLESGAEISVYDPQALGNTREIFGECIGYAKSAQDALEGAELAIVATKWKEFMQMHPSDFRESMKKPTVLDCRRIYDKEEFSNELEFHALGIGPEE